MQLLFGRSSTEVGAWQQIACLAISSIKLRLIDWLGLTALAFSHLCVTALVSFLLHQVVKERVEIAF